MLSDKSSCCCMSSFLVFFRISEMEAERGREGERGSALSPFVK